jgi:Flp pilus assembly protein TadB
MALKILVALLILEFVLRLFLEIRERRATQISGGVYALLRLVPLMNDIVPLPESRRDVPVSTFVEAHEKAHRELHHGVLRNLLKVILLCFAVGFLLFLLVRCEMPWWCAVLYLHLAAVPFRLFFHWYCWGQEYEADGQAFKALGKKLTKDAMRELAASEIPYTPMFALFYREHPTSARRSQKLLNR